MLISGRVAIYIRVWFWTRFIWNLKCLFKLGCANRDEHSWAFWIAIFPTKWRANEQQGEGWAPTRQKKTYLGGLICFDDDFCQFFRRIYVFGWWCLSLKTNQVQLKKSISMSFCEVAPCAHKVFFRQESTQMHFWLVNQPPLTYHPPEIRPYDQGLLTIGFP